jgi:hypothetical protein
MNLTESENAGVKHNVIYGNLIAMEVANFDEEGNTVMGERRY